MTLCTDRLPNGSAHDDAVALPYQLYTSAAKMAKRLDCTSLALQEVVEDGLDIGPRIEVPRHLLEACSLGIELGRLHEVQEQRLYALPQPLQGSLRSASIDHVSLPIDEVH